MKSTALALGAAMTLALSLGTTGVAAAKDHHRHHHDRRGDVVERYCRDNNRDGACDDYRRNGRSWDNKHYSSFYSEHRAAVREYYARERARERWQDDDADIVFQFRL